MTIGVYAEQPERVRVPQRPRSWPCGVTEGGWLCGEGDACRAADIVMEGSLSPPLHVEYARVAWRNHWVESTHTETLHGSFTHDGLRALHHRHPHPRGLR